MEQFFETFTKMSLGTKLAILFGAILVLGGGDYMFILSGQMDVQEQLISEQNTLMDQLIDKQKKAKNLNGFKREVERLRQRLSEAEEQLPKKNEIPKLLKDISYEGQQSGLTVAKFQQQPEQIKGTFAAVPVSMVVEGNYHEVAVFLDRISKLSRIVNVTNMSLSSPREVNKKIVLHGTYTATTYRFLERGAKKKKH